MDPPNWPLSKGVLKFVANFITPKFWNNDTLEEEEVEDAVVEAVNQRMERERRGPRDAYRFPVLSSQRYQKLNQIWWHIGEYRNWIYILLYLILFLFIDFKLSRVEEKKVPVTSITVFWSIKNLYLYGNLYYSIFSFFLLLLSWFS